MKKLVLLICLSLIVHASMAAPSADSLWKQANAAYQQKNYEAAITAYEQILRLYPATAEVHYNLGNAFYRTNRMADAVLQYEKARFTNPSLKGIDDNIILAQQRIPNAIKGGQDIFFVRWWQVLSAGDKAGIWAILSLLLFVSLLVLIWSQRSKRGSSMAPQVYLISSLTLVVLLLLSFFSAQNASYTDKAVVMSSTAIMVPEPGQTKGQVLVPQATVVHTSATRGQWVAVELPDSRSGWISSADLIYVQNARK